MCSVQFGTRHGLYIYAVSGDAYGRFDMFKGLVIGLTVVCTLNTVVGFCAAVEYQHWGWYFAATLNLLVAIVVGNMKISDDE